MPVWRSDSTINGRVPRRLDLLRRERMRRQVATGLELDRAVSLPAPPLPIGGAQDDRSWWLQVVAFDHEHVVDRSTVDTRSGIARARREARHSLTFPSNFRICSARLGPSRR